MRHLFSPKVQWILIGALLIMAVRSSINVWRLGRARGILTQAESQLDELMQKRTELQKQLAEVQSSEFVERDARNKLGFAKEGEVIIVLPKQEEKPTSRLLSTDEHIPNWQQWRKLWFGF